MSLKTWFYLGVSLLIHMGFLWLIQSSPEPSISPVATPTIIEVQWHDPTPPKKAPKGKAKNGKKGTTKGRHKGVALKQLYLPNYFAQKTAEFTAGAPSSYSTGTAGNAEDAFSTMNSMGVTETLGNNSFFNAIANKLHFHIEYPDIIAKTWHQGKFQFEVVVDKKGVLHTIRSDKGTSKHLKTYAILCLYKTFAEALPKKFWHQNRDFIALTIDIEFFLPKPAQTVVPNNHVKMFKNSFYVFRQRIVEGKLEYKMRQLRKKLPLYVSPMGAYIDFVAIYQIIDEWDDWNETFQRKENLEITRQQFERMLEKAQKEPR